MLWKTRALLKICVTFYQESQKRRKSLNIPKENFAYLTSRYRWVEKLPPAKYGGRYTITMIPGQGIGVEIMAHVRDIFMAMCAPVDFEVVNFEEPEDIQYAINSTRRNHCAITGHLEMLHDPKHLQYDSPNVELRRKLNLYVYVCRFKPFKSIPCAFPDVDIVVVRQSTEGEYSMLEHESIKGVVNSLKIITRKNVTATVRYAIEYAKAKHRKKITVVHKANVFKLTDGLFRDVCLELGQEGGIEMDELIVSTACMHIVQNPCQFDMILCPNLYGNIINNIISGLTGGSGFTAAGNFSNTCAVFEPACRNRALHLAGKNIANPTSFISASVELLRHLKLDKYAGVLQEALRQTIEDNGVRTADAGGNASTSEFISSVKQNLGCLLEDEHIYCPNTKPISVNTNELSSLAEWEAGLAKLSMDSEGIDDECS